MLSPLQTHSQTDRQWDRRHPLFQASFLSLSLNKSLLTKIMVSINIFIICLLVPLFGFCHCPKTTNKTSSFCQQTRDKVCMDEFVADYHAFLEEKRGSAEDILCCLVSKTVICMREATKNCSSNGTDSPNHDRKIIESSVTNLINFQEDGKCRNYDMSSTTCDYLFNPKKERYIILGSILGGSMLVAIVVTTLVYTIRRKQLTVKIPVSPSSSNGELNGRRSRTLELTQHGQFPPPISTICQDIPMVEAC